MNVSALDRYGQWPRAMIENPVSPDDLATRLRAAAEGGDSASLVFNPSSKGDVPLPPAAFAAAVAALDADLCMRLLDGGTLDAGLLTPDYRRALLQEGVPSEKVEQIHWQHDPYMLSLHHATPPPRTPLEPDLFCGDGLLAHTMGAGPAEELAWTLAATSAHLDAHLQAGTLPQALHRGLRIRLGVSNDLLTQIAKIRAARPLWHELLTHLAGGDQADRTPPLRIHAVGSPCWRTRHDIRMDLMRATTQSIAALAGGADRITPLGPAPSRSPRTPERQLREVGWSLRIVHILREEGRFAMVADPAFGAGLLEDLTRQIQLQAWERFTRIESQGGWDVVVRDGGLARELLERRNRRIEAFRSGKEPFVGVNRYAPPARDTSKPAPSDALETAAPSPFHALCEDRLAESRRSPGAPSLPVPSLVFDDLETGQS